MDCKKPNGSAFCAHERRKVAEMKAWMRWVVLVWAGLLLLGCAKRHAPAAQAPSVPEAPEYRAEMAAAQSPQPIAPSDGSTLTNAPSDRPLPAPSAVQGKTGAEKTEPITTDANRPLLIYEAEVGLRVEHATVAKTIEQVIDIAEQSGGYLISRNDQRVQVRVPSQSLRECMGSIEARGEVTRRSVTAQDVSEQYHDLEVRLRSLEAVRDRLEQFLSRATNVSEAMTIAKQLDAVGQQIDQVKGRMKYLRTRAAYSLLSVSITEKPEVVTVEPAPPPAPKAARLPVPWLHEVGIDTLTRLPKAED